MTSVKTETPNAAIKRTARNALRSKWSPAISLSLKLLAAQVLCTLIVERMNAGQSITAFLMVLSISVILELFLSLLMYGGLLFFLKLARGEEPLQSDLIIPFQIHPDRYLIVTLIRFLLEVVIYAPCALILFFMNAPFHVVMLCLLGWLIIGTILNIIVRIQFAFAPFLLLENADLGAIDSLKQSFALIRGYKKQMFFCLISFIGYIILAFCTLGTALLWVLPYLMTTLAQFYLHVTAAKKEEQIQE